MSAAAARNPLDRAAAIKRRLAAGQTLAAIAREFGMCRRTVRLIRDGKWPVIHAKSMGVPPPFVPADRLACAPTRCKTCGGKVVIWPCLKCVP